MVLFLWAGTTTPRCHVTTVKRVMLSEPVGKGIAEFGLRMGLPTGVQFYTSRTPLNENLINRYMVDCAPECRIFLLDGNCYLHIKLCWRRPSGIPYAMGYIRYYTACPKRYRNITGSCPDDKLVVQLTGLFATHFYYLPRAKFFGRIPVTTGDLVLMDRLIL